MPLKIDIEIKDNGLKALSKRIDELGAGKTLTVGIVEESPKRQFRYGNLQKFKRETASLLLRRPVYAKAEEIKQKLTSIGRKTISKGVDPDAALKALGEEIKADMGAQTDSPPQLRDAIIVKVEDDA